MRIYVASSWRNRYQPEVVLYLRKRGFEVYPHNESAVAPRRKNKVSGQQVSLVASQEFPSNFPRPLRKPVNSKPRPTRESNMGERTGRLW